MTQERAIAKYEPNMTIADLRTLAMDFAKSGYFPDAKEAVQAVVKIQAGLELGFGPVYSMTKIYIVKGKVMVSAEAMGAMVKRSGRYDYIVKALTDDECALDFTDNSKAVYTSKFTMKDAQRADLVKQDSGWAKYPRAMLMSKALSQGARIVCPHVIAGVYTPEDFGMETDANGAPKGIIEGTIVKEVNAEPPPVEMITENQRKRIFATMKGKGWDIETLHAYIWDHFMANHVTDLTKAQAGEIIEHLGNQPNVPLDNTPTQLEKPQAQVKTDAPIDKPVDIEGLHEGKVDLFWLTGRVKAMGQREKLALDNMLTELGGTGKTVSEKAASLSPEKARELVSKIGGSDADR